MTDEKIIVTCEISEERFRRLIAERPDIANAEAFWQEHHDALVYYFEKGVEVVFDQDAEMLMHNAIDAVKPFEPEGEATQA